MKKIAYTYCVVRYVHNPAAGESLNIGVILCAPETASMEARFEYRFERLSETFADFDGEHYRRVLRQVESAILNLSMRPMGTLILINQPIADAEKLGRQILPDMDLSVQLGPMLAGITDDPKEELAHIFERMITSQYSYHKAERRTDDSVWSIYQQSLVERRITRYLRPKEFVSENYEMKFEHAFKNERWHVLQPASMDYAKPEGLQVKATRLLGVGAALADNPELSTIYLLLGAPRKKEHKAAYIKAKNLLNLIPIKHEIIEENEADEFAKELADYLHKHGVEEIKY